MAPHPFERLLLDVLDKEDTFERQLSQEHINDTLIHKQIVPYDELDIVQGPDEDPFELASTFDSTRKFPRGMLLEEFIYKISPALSLVDRQRRNYRLMREWSKDRDW